jgi:hypothetical protein
MRYLWIGALVSIALLGAACSGSPSTTTRTTVHHHKARHRTTTTTTTTPQTRTSTTLASGPRDKLACAGFAGLGQDVHRGHRVIRDAFKRLFRELKHAENTKLRRDGHAAARALLLGRVSSFKASFVSIYSLCNEMK